MAGLATAKPKREWSADIRVSRALGGPRGPARMRKPSSSYKPYKPSMLFVYYFAVFYYVYPVVFLNSLYHIFLPKHYVEGLLVSWP